MKFSIILKKIKVNRKTIGLIEQDQLAMLREIYTGEHSPLTDAARSRGLCAHRFSKSDGDLSTFAGRQKLWRLIDELQPEHIYVAPECGPWGGWNRLNAMKSVTLWDKINDQQNHERIHIKLCAQLCSYQVTRNRHFHLEQPSGSGMITTPEFAPIQRMTQQALFDMCAFGLKIPQTDRFIKKRSQIWTGCSEIHDFLNQRNCQHDHDHQVIAGNIRQAGESVRLSRFCATYCRGFVHALARVLHESLTKERVFAAEDEPPSKKPRINPAVFKKPRVSDRSESDMLSNVPEASSSRVLPADSLWHEACRMAHLLAPRVGNTKHEVGTDLTTFVQGLVDDDFQVVCVFTCRGTDRLQVPVNAPAALGSPSGTDLLPDPEEDSFSVISCGGRSTELPTTRPSLPAGSNQRALAIAGTNRDLNHGDQAGLHARSVDAGPMGTKEDRLGKKHTGKTYYQTLCEDMGYLDWCRARYMSLPPPQKDFVDYCCAQLEHDAVAARQNAPGNQF